MPPTNTTFLTAIDLVTLPADVTQTDITDTGVNYTVYYKFTAPTDSVVIGAWGFSGQLGAGYRPFITAYDSAFNQILAISAQNKPIQFPVTAGQLYYLQFQKNLDNAGPNSLQVRVQVAPIDDPVRGNILVNDDSTGFPLIVLSDTVDNTVIKFVNDIAAGEAGDILFSSGIIALEDGNDYTIKLYQAASFSLIATVDLTGDSGTIRLKKCASDGSFYLGFSRIGSAWYKSLTSAGVEGTLHQLVGATSLGSLVANSAETILYYSEFGTNKPVLKWDLVNNISLGTLVAGIAGYDTLEMIILSSGDIVVLYKNAVADVIAKRYDTTGALLSSYGFGAQNDETPPRLTWALDGTQFWVWTHGANGVSVFQKILASTGVVQVFRSHTEYETGAMVATETASPASRFGNSFSCTFMIYPTQPLSGLLFIDPDNQHDTYPDQEKKIPNPTIRTALFGD